MITLKELSLRYGDRRLLDSVTANILARDRIGLVGSNGAGKSTLLRILAGTTEPDSGEIEKAHYVTFGYLPQEISAIKGKNLYAETESAFTEIRELRARIDEASARLHDLDHNAEEYHETLELIGGWEHQLQDMEEDKLRSRIEKVLSGLGFAQTDMQRDCGEFSGGWQMRIALAKLLLRQPSLLLLDEPTNHLDLDSLRWLEQFLRTYEGAVILVSHDRALLDNLTNRTFALAHGNLETYSGNYSFFETESAERKTQRERAATSQQRQIAKTERFIERFRSKNTKATQVQSRIKMLGKIERIELEQEESRVAFTFPEPKRTGHTVLEIQNLHKAYGELQVLRGIDWKLERGDRVAIVGVNGAGKSTLVRILAGHEPFQQGARTIGHNVDLAYFAQHQAEELNPAMTALEIAEDAARSGHGRKARDLLGSFLFTGDDVHKHVSVLSGGEKNRLALAKLLLQSFNCLILDEPTNHLDMRSKAVLQQALQEYPGTFIIVSHDRAFLDPITTRVLEVSNQTLRLFPGNITDYTRKIDAEREARNAELRAQDTGKGRPPRHQGTKPSPDLQTLNTDLNPKERRRLVAERNARLAPLRKKNAQLEETIATLEIEIAELETAMANPAFFKRGAQTQTDIQHHESLKRKNERSYADWETTQQQIADLETD